MSFLNYRVMSLRSALPRAVRTSSPRTFSMSARQFALNEDSTNNHRAKEIDSHKDDSLKKQKDGNAHWKKELASNSEAAIKADREDVTHAEQDIKNLQKEAEELGKSKQ